MHKNSSDKDKNKPIFTLPPYEMEQNVLSASNIINWWLEILSIPNTWRDTHGKGVKIAVLDTGINSNHLHLKSNILKVEDFTNSSVGAHDIDGHGTHVAGIIAARKNNRSVVGIASQAKLLVAKVLGDYGYGTEDAVANGIIWAIENDADIISMSLGSCIYSKKIHTAIKKAHKANKTVICTAGYKGSKLDTLTYPGKLEETIAVDSIDSFKKVSYFSSSSSQVDAVASDDQILSTYPPENYARLCGTSMAVPFVSSVVALMLSEHRRFGGVTPVKTYAELFQRKIVRLSNF